MEALKDKLNDVLAERGFRIIDSFDKDFTDIQLQTRTYFCSKEDWEFSSQILAKLISNHVHEIPEGYPARHGMMVLPETFFEGEHGTLLILTLYWGC